MKRKVSIIVSILFFGVIAIGFLSAPAYSGQEFWYGDLDGEGNPIVLGEVVPLTSDPSCDELLSDRGAVQGAMSGFDNSVPGEPALSIHYPDETWEGNTLLSCAGQGCRIASDSDPDAEILWGALLIDMNGEFVHGWLKEDMNGIPAKLLPGGRIMGGQGGGFGGSHVVMLNWAGNKLWEWEASEWMPGIRGWHHDFNLKDNPTGYYSPGQKARHSRNRVAITNRYLYETDTSHISSKYYLLDEVICLVDKKGNIKWTWEAWQHFEQMGFTDAAKEGIDTARLRGGGTDQNGTDWTHFNQIGWLGDNPHYRAGDLRFHPDNLIFDSRSNSMIGIIAHADHPDGDWDEGDIIWKVYPDSRDYPFGQIIGPHTAHMVPDGLPGAGNIIVFDNGGRSRFGSLGTPAGSDELCPGTWPSAIRDYSRFIEFDPTTFEIVQLYENNVGHDNEYNDWERVFFSSFISSVQRLPNGNTLICEGNQARVFEITPENKIVWEYNAISVPGGPGVIGRALYRAYRYPVSWVDDDL